MTKANTMTGKPITTRASAADILLVACSVILLGALLYHHYKLITFAVPLDYNEAGMLSVTATLLSGSNPYTFENQPLHAVVYPVLYNILVAPLASELGNTLPLHRAVAGLFILMSCGILYLVSRRQRNSRIESLAASVLWYAALLYYSTPIASPNSLGVLLFIASISIPWLYEFSNRSLLMAVGLGILAFYGKQYQIAGLGFIALYLFVCVSKKRALLFGAGSLVAFVIILGLVTYTSPYFLDNTVFAVNSVTGSVSTYQTAFSQLLDFAGIYYPLLIIMVIHIARTAIGKGTSTQGNEVERYVQTKGGTINLRKLDAPLLNRPLDYFWFCFFCSLLVIVLVIGKNPANHLTYLLQLMSPFLLLGCFRIVACSGKLKPLYYLLITATFYLNFSMLSHDFSLQMKNWDKIKQLMSGADEIFASTLVLPELIRSGKPVYDNGHTRYFYYAEEKPPVFAHGSADQDITQMWDRHVERINAMIEAQEFDLLVLDQWMLLPKPSPRSDARLDTQALLENRYYRSESIRLNLANRPGGGPYIIQVWKPKSAPPAEQEPREE